MGILDFLKPQDKSPSVHAAYLSIVKQARRPEFYKTGGAPDDFDGRFDMMALHLHLLLRRLRALGMGRSTISQDVFDMFFKDMDQAMREAGVGDMGVGKKVQKMVEAFYGRATAYDTAFDADTTHVPAAIRNVLARNLHPENEPSPAQNAGLDGLTDYTLALEAHLGGVALDDLLAGNSFQGAPQLEVVDG
ncbi:MAG: Uncharacterised protein [Rhodobiaceae bacterium UBA7378]|nr:MAG: Uncharacterised protein [Rhodobiaceae bacterium UBA7378]